MGQAIGQVLSFGVGVALSPVPMAVLLIDEAGMAPTRIGAQVLLAAGGTGSRWSRWATRASRRVWRRAAG